MIKPDHHTLEELIAGCIRNEHTAQRAIYQAYAGKMFAVCLRYGKSQSAAEEILQSGFVKVFKAIGKFRGEGSFEGWVRKVMVNTAIEYYRRATQIRPVRELTPELEPAGSAGYNEGLERLALEDLLGLIAALPDGYRMVFNLYAIEGYTHKEIAVQLGITEGGSKSQLSRARQLLQRALKKRQEVEYARLEK